MSNSFYHKELTDVRSKRRRKSNARHLILEWFLTGFCGYLKAERVGAIYPLATAIGTAFITSSASGAPKVCLNAC